MRAAEIARTTFGFSITGSPDLSRSSRGSPDHPIYSLCVLCARCGKYLSDHVAITAMSAVSAIFQRCHPEPAHTAQTDPPSFCCAPVKDRLRGRTALADRNSKAFLSKRITFVAFPYHGDHGDLKAFVPLRPSRPLRLMLFPITRDYLAIPCDSGDSDGVGPLNSLFCCKHNSSRISTLGSPRLFHWVTPSFPLDHPSF